MMADRRRLRPLDPIRSIRGRSMRTGEKERVPSRLSDQLDRETEI